MGYTHHWSRAPELPEASFAAAVADCRKLCEALPIPLGDWEGKGEPEFTPEGIAFNGHVESGSFARQGGLLWPSRKAESVAVAGTTVETGKTWCAGPEVSSRCVDENGDGSYESFVVERVFQPEEWQKPQGGKFRTFCKTNYRPYDLCVQCCLIILKEHLADSIQVRSDGKDAAWNEARDACQVFLGYGLDFALDDKSA